MALREPTFFILTALAGEPLYGYAIMREVETLSHGGLRLSAGTLYAALDRLTTDGLVAVDREERVDNRVRRYYRLTERGGAALRVEAAGLRERSAVATDRLATWRPALGDTR